MPIAGISIIDSDREWCKACDGLDSRESPRATSFCGHVMSSNYICVIEDTLPDERFADNPQVTGKPFVRFYIGTALLNKLRDLPVGVFCVKTPNPENFPLRTLLS